MHTLQSGRILIALEVMRVFQEKCRRELTARGAMGRVALISGLHKKRIRQPTRFGNPSSILQDSHPDGISKSACNAILNPPARDFLIPCGASVAAYSPSVQASRSQIMPFISIARRIANIKNVSKLSIKLTDFASLRVFRRAAVQ